MTRDTRPANLEVTNLLFAYLEAREADAGLTIDGFLDDRGCSDSRISRAFEELATFLEDEPPVPDGLARQDSARYELRGKLGEGGMGVVYRAYDRDLDREVALKRLRWNAATELPHDVRRSMVTRAVREIRVTAQLEHPGIVPVYDLSLDERGLPQWTMKLVRGRTLASILKANQGRNRDAQSELSLGRLITIVRSVCDAIAFAHERGFVHRDLKPANVMVDEEELVHVLDWGIAKPIDEPTEQIQVATHAPTTELTSTGDRIGTPTHMAPEQALGSKIPADHRSDVFGIGALLYHVLTGHAPHWGKSRTEVIEAATRCKPEERAFPPSVPSELRSITRRAMARSPSDRYPSVRALRDDLIAFQEGREGTVWHYGWGRRVGKWFARNKAVVTAAIVSAIPGLYLMTVVPPSSSPVAASKPRSRSAATSTEPGGDEQAKRLSEVMEHLEPVVSWTITPDSASTDSEGAGAAPIATIRSMLFRLFGIERIWIDDRHTGGESVKAEFRILRQRPGRARAPFFLLKPLEAGASGNARIMIDFHGRIARDNGEQRWIYELLFVTEELAPLRHARLTRTVGNTYRFEHPLQSGAILFRYDNGRFP